VRIQRGAQTYFEVNEPAPEPIQRSLGTRAYEDGLVVGRLVLIVVAPFPLGTPFQGASGRMWLDHASCPEALQCVNVSFEVLREACERWLATQAGDRDYTSFETWLHSVDEGLRLYESEYPYTFWDCAHGDMTNPFGPLEQSR
jgi:hypothetical protein